MGNTYITVKIYKEVPGEYIEVRLLVDTDASYSWIPRKILEKLGVKPTRRMRFKTIEGRIIEKEVGIYLSSMVMRPLLQQLYLLRRKMHLFSGFMGLRV